MKRYFFVAIIAIAWQALNAQEFRATHIKGDVWSSFSPEGKTLITTGTDGVLKVWDIETGSIKAKSYDELSLRSEPIKMVEQYNHRHYYSSNGRYYKDGNFLIDLETGKRIKCPEESDVLSVTNEYFLVMIRYNWACYKFYKVPLGEELDEGKHEVVLDLQYKKAWARYFYEYKPGKLIFFTPDDKIIQFFNFYQNKPFFEIKVKKESQIMLSFKNDLLRHSSPYGGHGVWDISGDIPIKDKRFNTKETIDKLWNIPNQNRVSKDNISSIIYRYTDNPHIEIWNLENNEVKKIPIKKPTNYSSFDQYYHRFAWVDISGDGLPKVMVEDPKNGKTYGPFIDPELESDIQKLVDISSQEDIKKYLSWYPPAVTLNKKEPLMADKKETTMSSTYSEQPVTKPVHPPTTNNPSNQQTTIENSRKYGSLMDKPQVEVINDNWIYTESAKAPLETIVQTGHSSNIISVGFHPTGKFVFTGSPDKTIKLWDLATGKQIRTFNVDRGHSACFSPDGKHIAIEHPTINGAVVIAELMTGRELKVLEGHNKFIQMIIYSPCGKYLVTSSYDEKAIIWDVSTGEIIYTLSHTEHVFSDIEFSPNGRYIVTAGGDKLQQDFTKNTAIIWNISTGQKELVIENDNVVHRVDFSSDGNLILLESYNCDLEVYDSHTGKIVKKFNAKGEEYLQDAIFSPDGKYVVTATNSKIIKFWNISSGTVDQQYVGHNHTITSLAFSPDGNYLLSGSYDHTAILWKVNTCERVQIFKSKVLPVSTARYFDNYSKIVTTNRDKVALWNLQTGMPEIIYNGQKANHDAIITPDCRLLITDTYDMHKVFAWDLTQNKTVFSTSHKFNIKGFALSPDGKQLVIGSNSFDDYKYRYNIWNIDANITRSGKSIIVPNSSDIISYSPTGDFIVVSDNYGTSYSYNPKNGEMINEYKKHSKFISTNDISSDGKLLATAGGDGIIKIWNTNTGDALLTIDGHNKKIIDEIKFNPQGSLLASTGWDNKLKIWDVASGAELNSFTPHSDNISRISFNRTGSHILTSSFDGTTKIFDANNGKEAFKILTFVEDDYAIITPDNYYLASKGAAKSVHFVQGLNVYTFDNFELIYNRPDIIAQRLGYADNNLIGAYKNAYLKRLKKMGFTESQVSTEPHLPTIKITSSNLPIETKGKIIKIAFEAKDTKYLLDRINVYVNDVNIYGSKGYSLKGKNLKNFISEVEVELSAGINKIQVSALNSKGVESLKQTHSVKYNGDYVIPNLYLVTIGVSEYKENDYNLTYAAKDAKDMVELFKTKNNDYGEINILEFNDEKAIKESITDAKSTLLKSKVNDMVVVFIAAHGVRDSKSNYFIATHDMNFENPALRGLPYEALEILIDGIPARKKLVFIDACNSGELDDDESPIAQSLIEGGTVSTRGFKSTKAKPAQQNVAKPMGIAISNDLFKEIFNDLRRGTGAMVISSAGGAEFAFESSEWKNGVFTYSVLEGIRTGKADANKDGEIRVSELRDYVFARVKELTQGKQNPTSRQENLEFDFRVW
jgi:WD40 repeat protein